MSMKELKKVLDKTMIDGLPQGLKDHIDKLIARGASKVGILSVVQVMVKRSPIPNAERGKLTLAAVEAYLETK